MRYYVSKYSIYTFLFCLTYLRLRWIFISLPGMPRLIVGHYIYLHEIIISVISILVVKKCFKVSRLD